MAWKSSMTPPATCRNVRGPNANHGETSSVSVVEEHADPVHEARQEVEDGAQRVRDRLGLVEEVETREIAPARVAADLDQSRAEHDPERQPAEEPEHERRGRPPRERARPSRSGTQEDRQEARLEQLDLPAVAVPVLADVDEGHVDDPQHGHGDRVGEAQQERDGERRARARTAPAAPGRRGGARTGWEAPRPLPAREPKWAATRSRKAPAGRSPSDPISGSTWVASERNAKA